MNNQNTYDISFYKTLPDGIPMIFSVICAKHKAKWVFVRHKERTTYEIPGGHIEVGEDAATAAKRELYEETGAIDFTLDLVSAYTVAQNKETNGGYLFYADIRKFAALPDFEIASISFFDDMPNNLTYPEIQPVLLGRVIEWLSEKTDNKK